MFPQIEGTLEMTSWFFQFVGKLETVTVMDVEEQPKPLLWCMPKSPELWKREQVIMMICETVGVSGEIHQLFLWKELCSQYCKMVPEVKKSMVNYCGTMDMEKFKIHLEIMVQIDGLCEGII